MAIGAPDYHNSVLPGRTTLGTAQDQLLFFTELVVGATSATSVTVYTVPAGKAFYLGKINIANGDSLLVARYYRNYTTGEQLISWAWDIENTNFPADAAWMFGPGDVFTITIWNPNEVALTQSINVFGTVVDI